MKISRRELFGMAAGATLLSAQDQRPIFRVKVDYVVLSFQVTDSKNHYVNSLKPNDFRIYE
ncbi:MAG TPA: VWA domain-containing protein, partial [Bryobacteraceae bacterium]|nr:VWA domain-containing protein [Bryobacteraceae bacterium]